MTFEPGARTAWHTHPLGQTLIVTAGSGWIQEWRGKSSNSGKVMSCGSRRGRNTGMERRQPGMTHIAIQEHLDGKVVEWMEKVTEEQYRP